MNIKSIMFGGGFLLTLKENEVLIIKFEDDSEPQSQIVNKTLEIFHKEAKHG
jgi:hypothetical protein